MPNPNQQNQANVLNGLDRQLTAHVPAAPVSSQADDPVNLPPRLSLLDVLRENLQRVGKQSIIHRIVVCGELTKELTNKSDLGSYFQKFFKQYQSDTDLITGILLIFPRSCVHLVEASSKVALSFLRELGRGSNPYLKNIKVLMAADDIPTRFYPFWASRLVDQPVEEEFPVPEDTISSESIHKTISQIVVNLAGLGKNLAGLQKSDLKPTLDQLYEAYGTLLPRNELLLALSGSKNVPSVGEWLGIFDCQINVVLESDLAWPVQAIAV